MVTVGLEPKCLTNPAYVPHLECLASLLLFGRSRPGELLRGTCSSLTHAHNEVSGIIRCVPAAPSSPTSRFGWNAQTAAKSGLTLRCRGRTARVTVRMTATIQVAPGPPEVLLPSGFYSANMSVPHSDCYAAVYGPILSWRFVPPGPITIRPSVVQVRARNPEQAQSCQLHPRYPSCCFAPHLTESAQGQNSSARRANFRASTDEWPDETAFTVSPTLMGFSTLPDCAPFPLT